MRLITSKIEDSNCRKRNNQGGRTPSPVNITLLQIGDDEYWKGSLARRVPVKRDYLAALVNKLCAADPQVVALDFDLHSPVVDGSYNDNPEYKGETLTLVDSVNRAAASGCKVVLPDAMDCASNNSCVREAGVLDGHDVALRH
ncbi:CHASE2 domain-containing protein [Paraburkholderia silviterrae]|uniref:CHASE2 domain-containing protein n=1 Tax=Paraburkholderia silviterrae TaxID=2528715 RepID=A0A4R5LYD3_9BURK|nr:CHASE2 domain-containing protein [Paraburkholderia silviterrae]TDG17376.1 CHASE2 domain-containing protein [Paraburkholderia silviterrae]